jgi:hypothetical protein
MKGGGAGHWNNAIPLAASHTAESIKAGLRGRRNDSHGVNQGDHDHRRALACRPLERLSAKVQRAGLARYQEELLPDQTPQKWASQINPEEDERRRESLRHVVGQEPRDLESDLESCQL